MIDKTSSVRSLLRVPLRGGWIVAVVAAVGALVFVLNRNPYTEENIYLQVYVPYADYLRGYGVREVVTYPLWGYPAVVAWLEDVPRMALQFVLALAVAVITLRAAGFKEGRSIWWHFLVAVAVIPWFALASLNSSSAVAVPLVWLSVFLFLSSLRSRRPVWQSAAAGALLGLALNFRTEFLPLAVILPIGGLLWRMRGPAAPRLAALLTKAVAYGVAAFLMLAPWAAFTAETSGAPRLTSSNGGAVSVISLGQLPDNPWGIIHNDAEARRVLREAGHEEVSPYSVEGDRILRRRFLDMVTAEPGGYVAKLVHNARNLFLGGLYFGDWERWLPGTDARRLDVVREKLKSRFGVNPNLAQIENYKNEGAWDEPPTVAESALVGVATAYVLGTDALVLAAAAAALLLIVVRRVTITVAASILMLAYVAALAILLQYQPRHITGAWPAMAILLLAAAPALGEGVRAAVRGARAARRLMRVARRVPDDGGTS